MKKKLLLGLMCAMLLCVCIFALASCTKVYTVTWLNWDGEVLERDFEVVEGTVPTYDSSIPTKESDDQFSYEFSGWDKEITPVTGETAYTAQFNAIVKSYNVVWYNWDGTVLQESRVEYGETPVYTGEIPTKSSSAQYNYTFSDWSPTTGSVIGDVGYYAQFVEEIRTYTITWKNWDGTVLAVDRMEYDSYPDYNGEIPTKEGNDEFYYAFGGWTPDITYVTEDATYTATFYTHKNQYLVTWLDWDGSELMSRMYEYGEMPDYSEWWTTPYKPYTEQYIYTFAGWSPTMDAVSGNVTYVAQYTSELRKYTVTWKNWDGTVLENDQNVEYGAMPMYDGEVPSKDSTASKIYIFSGWSPTVDVVTGDVTYRAQFITEVAKYTITWTDWDGTVLEVDKDVPYGSEVSFDSPEPYRAPDAQYTYTFSGWSTYIWYVYQDVTVVAEYLCDVNAYKVTWENWNGDIISYENVKYGTTPSTPQTPSRPSTDQYEYVFIGWSPEITSVVGEATYIARFEERVRTYTVTFDAQSGYFGADYYDRQKTIQVPYGEIPDCYIEPVGIMVGYKNVSFIGWDRDLEAVCQNTTYYARYEYSEKINYDVCLVYDHVKGTDNEIKIAFEKNEGRYTYTSSYTIDWGDGTTSNGSGTFPTVTHKYTPFLDSGIIYIYVQFDYTVSGQESTIAIKGGNKINENIREIYIYQSSGEIMSNSNTSNGLMVAHQSYKIRSMPHLRYVEFVSDFYKVSSYKEGPSIKGGSSSIEISNNPILESVKFASFTGSTYISSSNPMSTRYCAIDDDSFAYNPNLKSIDFGRCTIDEIGISAFSGCTVLSSIKGLDLSKVKTIGEDAFGNCEVALNHITLSDSIEEISRLCFAGCDSLQSISITSSVTSICEYAFAGCTNLRYIYYSSTMSDFLKIAIGFNAFNLCTDLQVICTDGVLSLS